MRNETCVQQSAPEGLVLIFTFRHLRDLSGNVVNNSNQSQSKDVDANCNVQPGSLEEQKLPVQEEMETHLLNVTKEKLKRMLQLLISGRRGFLVLYLLLSKWYQIALHKFGTICIKKKKKSIIKCEGFEIVQLFQGF